jgi:DNA invertase Pin-like site-specific DNA recombinase
MSAAVDWLDDPLPDGDAPAGWRTGIAYYRISDDPEHDELGVRRQRREVRAKAKRDKVWLVAEYTDDDRSAFTRRRRPDYERFLEHGKRVDVVMAWHPDRMTRGDLVEIERLIVAMGGDDGTPISTCETADYDVSTPHGRMIARVTGSIARYESEHKARRLRSKMAELVSEGKSTGGPAAYGYRRVGYKNDPAEGGRDTRRFVPDPAEQAIVVEVVERVARGETLTRIADDLNRRDVPTTHGTRWTISTVRRIALNPRYIGRLVHKGEDVGPGDWDALVDEATWRRAGALLNADDRPKRRSSRRYLLTGGMLVCGTPGCGQPLRSKQHHARTGMVPVYACRPKSQGGCGGVTIRAEPVEQLVAERVIDIVESTRFAKALRTRGTGDRKAAAAVAKISAELDELEAAKESGAITLREYMRFRDGARARLVEAQERMASDTTEAATGRFAGQTGALRAMWDDPATTLDRKQAIIRATIKPVVIAPVGKSTGNRFDPDRVTIERLI